MPLAAAWMSACAAETARARCPGLLPPAASGAAPAALSAAAGQQLSVCCCCCLLLEGLVGACKGSKHLAARSSCSADKRGWACCGVLGLLLLTDPAAATPAIEDDGDFGGEVAALVVAAAGEADTAVLAVTLC